MDDDNFQQDEIKTQYSTIPLFQSFDPELTTEGLRVERLKAEGLSTGRERSELNFFIV